VDGAVRLIEVRAPPYVVYDHVIIHTLIGKKATSSQHYKK
jgi:hypothetical protein